MTADREELRRALEPESVRKLLAPFYKTVDVMNSAHNSDSKLMSIWADDMKAVEAVMLFLEKLRDGGAALHEGERKPWFKLNGDARLGRCDTENCCGQPTWRLEAGGIGSNYCSGCKAKIESQAKEPEASGGLCADAPHAVRVGEAGADQSATSEHMDVTAGETAPNFVAWIAFAHNGNIRFWTSDAELARDEKQRGLDLRAFTLAELVTLAARHSPPDKAALPIAPEIVQDLDKEVGELRQQIIEAEEKREQIEYGIGAVAFALDWTELRGKSLEEWARDIRRERDALRTSVEKVTAQRDEWCAEYTAVRNRLSAYEDDDR